LPAGPNLSTTLDDFSRYIIAWKLCTTMTAGGTSTLEKALAAAGCDQVRVPHKPRLLSDNGPSYIAAGLAEWLDERKIEHLRGAPCHPQTQGKIERGHQTLKNRILLENYYLPGQLEARIDAFIEHYNHRRYHESLNDVTPADVFFGRAQTILLDRQRIKQQTIRQKTLAQPQTSRLISTLQRATSYAHSLRHLSQIIRRRTGHGSGVPGWLSLSIASMIAF
jgi:putative transposase